jgi:predicted nucleic acid-binding protein
MIVDANVAAMWLVEETHSIRAAKLITRTDLAAPDIIDVEIGQTLTRRTRQRLLDADQARRLWAETLSLPITRRSWNDHAEAAFSLSLRLRATFNDCIYLALALSSDDVLITADERFVRSVRTDRTLHRSIVSLADV